jgi:hypothetical protein
MTNADAGYYKTWKARLYSYVKYCFSAHLNIFPAGLEPTFDVPDGTTEFMIRLPRGPHFWQFGFRGTITGAADIPNALKNIYLTQRNVGGYKMVEKVCLAELFGGTEGMGDSFRNVKWQWIAGEDMLFTLENPLNIRDAGLSITLFGKNVYASR